jgi:hypothetical protein
MNQATTTIDDAPASRARVAREQFASLLQRQGALIALVLVCVIASYLLHGFSHRAEHHEHSQAKQYARVCRARDDVCDSDGRD